MRPESKSLLFDMRSACDRIDSLIAGKTEAQFVGEIGTHDGVQWNFAVIGEALSKLRRVDPDTCQRISEWGKIISFRNQLIHGYHVIDDNDHLANPAKRISGVGGGTQHLA